MQSISYSGVTEAEAQELLRLEGHNELPSQKKQSSFKLLMQVLSEPMLLLLVCAGTIYLFMGEMKDALMLLFAVFIVIGITFYQEHKTEKTLEALRDLSSPRALVIRDGVQKRIAGRDVVRGDLIMLREGDRVPADATVLSCENLLVDESLLTGESISVRKTEWDGAAVVERPGGDDLPFVFSGSMIVSGHGLAKVDRIGVQTEIGKIGKSLETITDEKTLLHKETARVVRAVATIGLVLCVAVVGIYTVRGDMISGLLSGLTLGMAILPEEFPVVLVIFLTLGAWRISKKKVLTRRSAAIETLGAATVLCTDKTGTLTLNKMELQYMYAHAHKATCDLSGSDTDTPHECNELLLDSVLASQLEPYDPIEKEIVSKASRYHNEVLEVRGTYTLRKEYPLSKNCLALTHAWARTDSAHSIVFATKGAPETVLELCTVPEDVRTEVLSIVDSMSKKGLRILGVARAVREDGVLPNTQHELGLSFTGLIGFIDPPRETARGAVEEAYGAGMRVLMITGDYPGTARFIADKIGIKDTDGYLTGDDLEKLPMDVLKERVKTTNIYARVLPEQKLLLVDVLKANGEIVAMTGDGVNDAPALKSAHIGIAMGERGTDVAREAASLVLLNDDFSSIVSAIQLGRRIYDNLKRSMGYILAVHVPIAGMSIAPLFLGLPPVLLPAHIAFLELIIDPACSTVFESQKEATGIMKRRPRDLHVPMFSFKMVTISMLQGLGSLLVTIALYSMVMHMGRSEMEARSFAFTTIVLSNLVLIIVNLSWERNFFRILVNGNAVLFAVLGGAVASLGVVLYVPFFANLFRMAPLSGNDLLMVTVAVAVSIAWFEIFKLIMRHKKLRVHVQ